MLGIEKGERIHKKVKAELIQKASDQSYSKSGKLVVPEMEISSTTVMHNVRKNEWKMNIEERKEEEKIKSKNIFIQVDEDHVKQRNKKGCTISKIVTIYTRKRTLTKPDRIDNVKTPRRELVDKFTFSELYKDTLAKKIKDEYPRLKIIIGADALYASKPIMDICKENGWKYIIRFKEGKIPTLYNEFKRVVERENESKKANYEYVTNLDYQEEKVNIIKYIEANKKTEFVYMTDLPISNKNIEATVGLGRKRWKIENEGFNVQKNRTFDIGHLYSKNQTAIKAHYLMIQIIHILRQLLENGVKEIKELNMKLKEISQTLKNTLISTITNLTVHNKIQLRFD